MGLIIALVLIVATFLILLAPKFFSFLHFAIMRAPFFIERSDSSAKWAEKKMGSGKDLGIRHLKQGNGGVYLFMKGFWFVPFQANMVHKVKLLYPGKKISVDGNLFAVIISSSKSDRVYLATTNTGNCAMFPFGYPTCKFPLQSISDQARNYAYEIARKSCVIIVVRFNEPKRCELWFDCKPS